MKKYLLSTSILNLLFLSALSGQVEMFKLISPGGQLAVNKFSTYYYASCDLNGITTFSLIPHFQVSTVEISPLSSDIPFTLTGNKLSFTISKPGYSLIRFNDTIKIFFFAEEPETIPESDVVDIVSKYGIDPTGISLETHKIQKALDEISGTGKTLYFPPGEYRSGQLRIRSDTKIYIPGGAVLNADSSSNLSYFSKDFLETRRFLYMNGAENVEIRGHGVINGNGHILRKKFGDDARFRLILAASSRNIRIEGLTLMDPGSWNTQVILCEDVIFHNVKLLNDTDLSNTDGFDPDASKRILIEDCFACCGDDNVAIKTTGYSGLLGDADDITVRGCVFLTKKSALKVGTETRGDIMKNITFENNDVLECDRGMALYVSDGACLDSILFINNRFERCHPDAQRKAIHFLINKRNPDSRLGTIGNVLIKDCFYLTQFPRKSVIKSEGEVTGIFVTIDNLVFEGQKAISSETAGIEATNAEVSFK